MPVAALRAEIKLIATGIERWSAYFRLVLPQNLNKRIDFTLMTQDYNLHVAAVFRYDDLPITREGYVIDAA